MNITKIEKRMEKEEIYDIYIENKFYVSISHEEYIVMNLYEKTSLNKDEIDRIIYNNNFKKAKLIAFKYVCRKKRTVNQVKLKLLENTIPEEVIQDTISYLVEADYLNDVQFTKSYISERLKLNPKSIRQISRELLNKGIDGGVITKEILKLNIDEIKIAKNLIEKKFRNKDLSALEIKKKAINFLKYRGYTFEIINKIINFSDI